MVLNKIQPFLVFCLCLYSINIFAQTKTNNVNSLKENYNKRLLEKESENLKKQKSNLLNLNKRISSYSKELENKFSKHYTLLLNVNKDSINITRKDSLQMTYNTLFNTTGKIFSEWTARSNKLIKDYEKETSDKRKLFNESFNKDFNINDKIDEYSTVADSLLDVFKDSSSNVSNEYYDLLSDNYDTIKDSLETICSILKDNQSAENDLFAEKQEAIADSLAQEKERLDEIYKSGFSAYASISMDYDRNPLFNSELIGDQLKQPFFQFKYVKNTPESFWQVLYMGELMAFQKLSSRNYYEHSITLNLLTKYINSGSAVKKIPTSIDEELECNSSLNFSFNLRTRHNKNAFNDYDNYGAGFSVEYKNVSGSSWNYSLTNNFGFTAYSLIGNLSNITDAFQLQIKNVKTENFEFGVNISPSIKYYTKAVYDTTLYNTSSPTPIKGKNKNQQSTQQSSVKVQPNGTIQLAAGIFFKKKWNNGTLETNLLYRYNPKEESRFIKQFVNTTFLSEDIYNEFLNYQGFDSQLKFNQKLPLDMEINLTSGITTKKYILPAFDLAGSVIASNRKDIFSTLELTLSKYFDLGKTIALDINLVSGFIRNQSNDTYNDFSSYYTSIAVGIGF